MQPVTLAQREATLASIVDELVAKGASRAEAERAVRETASDGFDVVAVPHRSSASPRQTTR